MFNSTLEMFNSTLEMFNSTCLEILKFKILPKETLDCRDVVRVDSQTTQSLLQTLLPFDRVHDDFGDSLHRLLIDKRSRPAFELLTQQFNVFKRQS